jgi:hypothetical protein
VSFSPGDICPFDHLREQSQQRKCCQLIYNFDACFPILWKKDIIAYEAFAKQVIL